MWPALWIACAEPVPGWAFDTWEIDTSSPIQVPGFGTWYVYDTRWKDDPQHSKLVCAVVVGITASPTTPCEKCTDAWTLQSLETLETDCDSGFLRTASFHEATLSLGLGDLSDAADAPYPGTSRTSWVDEGFGWERHGWAWSLEDATETTRQADEGWTQLWATSAWRLDP